MYFSARDASYFSQGVRSHPIRFEGGREHNPKAVLAGALSIQDLAFVQQELFQGLPIYKCGCLSSIQRLSAQIQCHTTIVTPLFSTQLDVCELARTLEHSGFRGQLLCLSPKLPSPQLVISEIASIAPTLTFEMIDTPYSASKISRCL
jgi:hypothetical protein